jgi:ABC-type antimicrobial peptide transport system permease subunit
MSETEFPINDLLRRKFQTSLIIVSIMLCVASTVFLLLFGDTIGFGVLSMAEGRLTVGFAEIFSQFTIFVEILMFIVGAVIVSFLIFMMMSQRVKDIGLMKAAGCPNDLTFGYFMNELLVVTLVGCLLGVGAGLVADFAATIFLQNSGYQIPQKAPNIWLVLVVFVVFFVFGLIFGLKPVLDTTKVEPAKAVSPTYHLGLSKEPGFKPVSRSGITAKIALRSLFRRKSATIRIVMCMACVFVLLTAAVAGGMISDQTSRNWIEKAIGKNVIMIAHRDVANQYQQLLSAFYEPTKELPSFNYTSEKYLMNDSLANQLASIPGVVGVDPRLVLESNVVEYPKTVYDSDSQTYVEVGDTHRGQSLVVGIDPEKSVGRWVVDGQFLNENASWDAVVGDSLAKKMFVDPIGEGIFAPILFNITGVCLDPINNGNVTYVPLRTLQSVMNVTGKTNVIMAKVDSSSNYTDVLNRIKASLSADPDLEVIDLNEILSKSLGFVDYLWSAVMLLPLFSLAAASFCLIGYVMLTITEGRQEFGVLRALGAKPWAIVKIVSLQSFVVLISSYAVGVSIGIMLTLIVLVSEPIVTSLTVLEIAAWLLLALAVTFLVSLYPALRFTRKRILETMI